MVIESLQALGWAPEGKGSNSSAGSHKGYGYQATGSKGWTKGSHQQIYSKGSTKGKAQR